jgi:hypothetical protein
VVVSKCGGVQVMLGFIWPRRRLESDGSSMP